MGLSAVPVEELSRQAREIEPRHLAAVPAAVLFAIGWVIGHVGTALWWLATWSFVAVRAGYRQAKGRPVAAPTNEQLLAENARLRAELRRVG